MNKIAKKILSLTLAVSMLSGTAAMAAEFTDMPTDWTATAVENAVKNGLIKGYSDNTVRPNDNITRAQMATIVSRCFKATAKADLSRFKDVSEGQWFYNDFAVAVGMGAFGGDNLGNLNPDNNITFQETFKVIASIFGLIANTDRSNPRNDIDNVDYTIMDSYADAADVAQWARPFVGAIVEKGYWSGIDGKLTPNAHITRAQFAVLMDNMVKTYIDEAGEYTDLPDGNVLIRTDGANITAKEFNSSIILSDSVLGEEPTTINIDQLSGLLILRGGADKVTFKGHVNHLKLIRSGIKLYLNDTDVYNTKAYGVFGAHVALGELVPQAN